MNASVATPEISERQSTFQPLAAGERLSAEVFHRIRRTMLLDGCKWDPQVGDVSTLAPFPLYISSSEWGTLTGMAESLSAETLAAETEILHRPELLKRLSLPGSIRKVLQSSPALTPAAARVMRFDFHPTTEGWRISEVNSDVPGGYCESSLFTSLISEQFPGTKPTGNPGDAVADAIIAATRPGARIAMLTAPGYMEDHQVVSYVAKCLRARGCQTYQAKPSQLTWREGHAYLPPQICHERVDGIFRFHQAEWLAQLPRRSGWEHFFRGGQTPVTNPGTGIIAESKRFPLVWDDLRTPLPMWRQLLPETRDPREVPWRTDDSWLVKAAFCNTGDAVFGTAQQTTREWQRAKWNVRFFPNDWVAQRRFDSVPLATPDGDRHVCLGVYTVNGRAAGAYVRMAQKPLIDFAAYDVALLVRD